MNVPPHAVYLKTLSEPLPKWQQRRARARAPALRDAVLMRLRLDLDALLPRLVHRYSPSPRGRPPGDPRAMCHALLRMTILRSKRLAHCAHDLRPQPRLAVIAGLAPLDTPSVGPFSRCMDRLEDGPSQPACPHRGTPSSLRKGTHVRNLSKEQADTEAARPHLLAHWDALTGPLTPQPLDTAAQPSPDDLHQRREDALRQAAVIPAAARGLLGARSRRLVGGAGAALSSGASSTGKPACTCREQRGLRCDCDRFSTDPTADWGADASPACYDCGHTSSQPCGASGDHALPVPRTIGQAAETDFPLSMKSRERFLTACAENQRARPRCAVGDEAGHAALGHYELRLATQMRPVIALTPSSGSPPTPPGTAERVNATGVPLCPAGWERRRHTPTAHRLLYHGPLKRPTHYAGNHGWPSHVAECPRQVRCAPESKLGPRVFGRAHSAPRFAPAIARDSKQCREIRPLRSGGERANSPQTVVHPLASRPCRAATPFLVRRSRVSLVEPAKAWRADARKALGEDWRV